MPTSPIWREIQMKQETIFLSVAANHFSEMRLMAEGAIALYKNIHAVQNDSMQRVKKWLRPLF